MKEKEKKDRHMQRERIVLERSEHHYSFWLYSVVVV
jgi:hypothetical protein